MLALPSPIPHPLFVLHPPDWLADAVDFVIGVDWPEGDEKAMRELAGMWTQAGRLMGPLLEESDLAALDAVAAMGGAKGEAAQALLKVWRQIGAGPQANLTSVTELFDDLAKSVADAADEVESVKLELYVELLSMMAELLLMAAMTAVTAGASLAGAGPVIISTRFAIQQLLRRAAEKVHSRAAARLSRGRGLKFFARMGLDGLEKRAQERASTGAAQPYLASKGDRSGVDSGDLMRSFGSGTLVGSVSNAASIGGIRASGPLDRLDERSLRGAGGEMLGEISVGVVSGQRITLHDLTMAGGSGSAGSAMTSIGHETQAVADSSILQDISATVSLPDPTAVPATSAAAVPPQHTPGSVSLQATPVAPTVLGQSLPPPTAAQPIVPPPSIVTPPPPPLGTVPPPPPSGGTPPPSASRPPPSAGQFPSPSPAAAPSTTSNDLIVGIPLYPRPDSEIRRGLPAPIAEHGGRRTFYQAFIQGELQSRLRQRLLLLVDTLIALSDDAQRRKKLHDERMSALEGHEIESIEDELWWIVETVCQQLGEVLTAGGLTDGEISQATGTGHPPPVETVRAQ